MANATLWDGNDRELDDFEGLIANTIDALPEEFQRVLEKVAVVSERGSEACAYGHYFGDGIGLG